MRLQRWFISCILTRLCIMIVLIVWFYAIMIIMSLRLSYHYDYHITTIIISLWLLCHYDHHITMFIISLCLSCHDCHAILLMNSLSCHYVHHASMIIILRTLISARCMKWHWYVTVYTTHSLRRDYHSQLNTQADKCFVYLHQWRHQNLTLGRCRRYAGITCHVLHTPIHLAQYSQVYT